MASIIDNSYDENYPDTALEIVDSKDDQTFSKKFFNAGRGEVKLTRLNVEKKHKSPIMSIKKPLVSSILI